MAIGLSLSPPMPENGLGTLDPAALAASAAPEAPAAKRMARAALVIMGAVASGLGAAETKVWASRGRVKASARPAGQSAHRSVRHCPRLSDRPLPWPRLDRAAMGR